MWGESISTEILAVNFFLTTGYIGRALRSKESGGVKAGMVKTKIVGIRGGDELLGGLHIVKKSRL